MDLIAESFTQGIVEAINSSIPKATINSYVKLQWNNDLRALRKVMLSYSRRFKKSNYTCFKDEFLAAKNKYFNTIKLVKKEHWNLFLAKEDSKSIFKAMSYTKEYLVEPLPSIYNNNTKMLELLFNAKCDVLCTTLFLAPLITTAVNLNYYSSSTKQNQPILS